MKLSKILMAQIVNSVYMFIMLKNEFVVKSETGIQIIKLTASSSKKSSGMTCNDWYSLLT